MCLRVIHATSVLREAPIASILGAEIGILICSKHLEVARILFESVPDLLGHALIQAHLTLARCEGEQLGEQNLILLTVISQLTYQAARQFSKSYIPTL
jgi:hypothetical protein